MAVRQPDFVMWDHEYAGPCSRCGGGIPNDETPGAYSGAFSRLDNRTYICSRCGEAEATFNWSHPNQPLPPLDQPIIL